MIERVKILDQTKTPIKYLDKIDTFKDGTEFIFKPGVNILVGLNGSGKTTLFKIIEYYLMVGDIFCERGEYNHNVNRLMTFNNDISGIDVFADYEKNVFRLAHFQDRGDDTVLKNVQNFRDQLVGETSSQGEKVVVALNSLFNYMFSPDAKLNFDYSQVKEFHPRYYEYVQNHKIKTDDEYTILMDEPDRNLDLQNLDNIKSILSFHKEQTQLIVSLHNPLLIVWARHQPHINMIELSPGYAEKVEKLTRKIIEV